MIRVRAERCGGTIGLVSVKDAIFIAGVLLILLVALGQALPERPDYLSPARRKEAASNAHLGYVIAVATWACLVNVFEFRRGLTTRVGLPEAVAWALVPIGVVALLALSVAQMVNDEWPWWLWIGLLLLYVAAGAAWLLVAGPGSW